MGGGRERERVCVHQFTTRTPAKARGWNSIWFSKWKLLCAASQKAGLEATWGLESKYPNMQAKRHLKCCIKCPPPEEWILLQCPNYLKWFTYFKPIPNKLPMTFFIQLEKHSGKHIWKHKRTARMTKAILSNENEAAVITTPMSQCAAGLLWPQQPGAGVKVGTCAGKVEQKLDK